MGFRGPKAGEASTLNAISPPAGGLSWTLLVGDVRERLADLPDGSVQCVVTSPPFWGLRDYGHSDQLGLEPTPEEYVANMVAVFREVRRVLRDDGVLFINLGDSYNANGREGHGTRIGAKQGTNRASASGDDWNRPTAPGLKPKDLVGIPWRVAFALQADGWYLRSDIIWSKPNPMPESVRDRPTKAHEYVFLLSKSARYYYDSEAIAEEATHSHEAHMDPGTDGLGGGDRKTGATTRRFGADPATRNARSVWTITTKPYPGAHFATFPPELAERCIKAGTSGKGCCPECGAPWERVVEREPMEVRPGPQRIAKQEANGQRTRTAVGSTVVKPATSTTTGFQPTCDHDAEPVPCTVLDPFGGSGTTAAVAVGHGRRAILIELNPDYAPLIRDRCGALLESLPP